MTNIPTELLRTLIAVVDMRSFTKAAQSLGVTQPAVSAQIKRLQLLLGRDLLDKSAPGVSLTPTGERVTSQARRLLSINDQIVDLGRHLTGERTLRVGVPGDFVGPALWQTLAGCRSRWPDLRLHVRGGGSDNLLRELRQGDLDLVLAMSEARPHEDARRHWTEDLVWVRGESTALQPSAPVPLLTHSENCVFHRHAVGALERAGRSYIVVFTASRIDSLSSAIAAGLGVMALARSLAASPELAPCEDGSLPKLSDIICNVCVRNDNDSDAVDEFADALGDGLRCLARTAPTLHEVADASITPVP